MAELKAMTFEWKDGNKSLNSYGVELLRENNIKTQYHMQKLQAFVYGSWHTVMYAHLYGETYQVCFQ